MTDRELSALRAARIGFVFQQFFLAEHQTVLDNVAERRTPTLRRQVTCRDRSAGSSGVAGCSRRLRR
jgi:ABC-type lipoprotein export system ATPase subunit